jgi:lysophospholipase L1-like esterase
MLMAGVAAAAGAQTQLAMNVGGATATRSVAGEQEWLYQWPGIYFEARFRGDAVSLHMDDANNWFDVLLDGKPEQVLKRPGKTVVVLNHLGAGEHGVRLQKRTETQASTGAFAGFFVERKKDALAPKVRPRKILFLGDSVTVGYGNTSPSMKCNKEQVFETTDTSEAFAPLVAKHFDAEYQVRAFSGLGLVRNFGGVAYPQYRLGSLWQRAIFADESSRAEAWEPQVIVIGIGGNDFSTPLRPAEKWKTQPQLTADYETTYLSFLKQLRELYPHTLIVMFWAAEVDTDYARAAQAVYAQAQAAGVSRLDRLELPKIERTGCNGHPSVRGDASVALLLDALIERHHDVWQGN